MPTSAGPLADLAAAGVSIWLDDLDRERIASGALARAVAEWHVTGVTTNPTIFDKALSSGSAAYAESIQRLARSGADALSAVRVLTTDDVREACDVLRPAWEASSGLDGRVSIEVDPRLAHDTQGTIAQARDLWAVVDRPNAMIKIPATREGLPAITEVLAAGISVNVTLIFGVERYAEVMEAWLAGLEAAARAGHDISGIASVASFFVSRVDTLVDSQLDSMGTPQARELRGQAAIANARMAWAAYEDMRSDPRWRRLAQAGARPQRPLWASTGVKDPTYDDTRYVVDLVVDGCVNTMPEATLLAVQDHGHLDGDRVTGRGQEAAEVWQRLRDAGIDTAAVVAQLEAEGVDKFVASWNALLTTVERALELA